MKKYWLMAALGATFALSSCMEDVYKEPQAEEEAVYNDFDFSTVAEGTDLEVGYLNMGVEAPVYFEIYDECPVNETETGYELREGVQPLFAAYTGADGVYKGQINLPTYMTKAYIYSPAFYAQTLVETDVVNGRIAAQDATPADDEAATRASSNRRKNGKGVCYMVEPLKSVPSAYQDKRWNAWLGDYTKAGYVDYEYKGGELVPAQVSSLYSVHSNVININKSCPEVYRSYSDMYVNEDAEVGVTFLGQNTCWNCALGYYYYKEGAEPKSLDDVDVVLLFPNTQDGKWANNPTNANKTRGIERGTTVQLMYYPNIAKGSSDGATTVFPAGYRIGFVLATNAWSERVSGFGANTTVRSATSEGLSVTRNGTAFNAPRTAVYKYGDAVMISFEDYDTDDNFSDVVITMKSNPVDAISDVPVVDPETNKVTTSELKGIYAFEDEWPQQGDYDMNDVMVRYDYSKTIDDNNNIYNETFTFKTFQNYAVYSNGVAFTLNRNLGSAKVTCEKSSDGVNFTETTFTYETDTKSFLLTENMNAEKGATYRVTVDYGENTVKSESDVQVFIFREGTTPGRRWEVHIAKQAPTSKMDTSYFGTKNDASQPESGIYYVRSGNYPFAFFLSGANETDLSKLLETANEKIAIDKLYPAYSSWVTSGGQNNQDWYKK